MRRGAFAFSAALFSAGCFSLESKDNPYLIDPPPKPEVIREIPHTFALSMLSGRGAGLTLTALNTGTLAARGEAVSALKSYSSKVKLDVPVFLIRHGKKGLILFSTGLSPNKKRRPDEGLLNMVKFLASFDYGFRFKQKKGEDTVSLLKKAGIAAEDVSYIIVPYWDAGTVGLLDAFPNAKVAISRREWEWRKEVEEKRKSPLDTSVFEGKISLRLVDINNQPPFGAFENGLDFFEDGSVFLVNLPGRTPGNMGVWLNLDGGPVLLTGGATFVVDNYLDLALPVKGKVADLQSYWLSLHAISAMRAGVPQLVVFPGNDLAPLKLVNRSDIRRLR